MQIGDAVAHGGSLGTGASTRTRRALGAVLALLVVAAAAAVFVSKRDPSDFTDRRALPSCGSTTAAPDNDIASSAAGCFDAALGGSKGAELRVVSYTPEGDPIVSYYRALPGGGAEVLVDSTKDNFGSMGWGRRTCPDAVSLAELGDCAFKDL